MVAGGDGTLTLMQYSYPQSRCIQPNTQEKHEPSTQENHAQGVAGNVIKVGCSVVSKTGGGVNTQLATTDVLQPCA